MRISLRRRTHDLADDTMTTTAHISHDLAYDAITNAEKIDHGRDRAHDLAHETIAITERTAPSRPGAHDLANDTIITQHMGHDLAFDTITDTEHIARSSHNIEQDAFWFPSERSTRRQANLPQTLGNRSRTTPKPALARVMESTNPGKTLPPLPAKKDSETLQTPRRVPPSGERGSNGQTVAYQSQASPKKDGDSPVKKPDDSSPKTPRKEASETFGARDSPNQTTSAAKNRHQTTESSDISTWKERLRRVGDTRTSMDYSPGKPHAPSAPASQTRSGQPTVTLSHDDGGDEAVHRSPTRRETGTGKQIPKGYQQMESTSHGQSSKQGEEALSKSKMASGIPDSGSQMPMGHHICEWRSRYLGLSDAFDKLKRELDVALEHQASQGAADRDMGNAPHPSDDGIEGLTIIVHRRCKEDLVLNTDLREEELVPMGEQ